MENPELVQTVILFINSTSCKIWLRFMKLRQNWAGVHVSSRWLDNRRVHFTLLFQTLWYEIGRQIWTDAISLYLTSPTHILARSSHSTGKFMPYSFPIVCEFFNVPHWTIPQFAADWIAEISHIIAFTLIICPLSTRFIDSNLSYALQYLKKHISNLCRCIKWLFNILIFVSIYQISG